MATITLFLFFLLVLTYVTMAQPICTSNLLIDDYSRYTLHINSLGQFTSDDGTTRDLIVDVVNKTISFDAITGSYFYSRFSCETATGLGYNAISFPIRGPVEATFELELQTAEFCPVVTYTSYYYKVPTEMTEEVIIVTVPLNLFAGANLNALNSIVFGGFTPGFWEIGATELICANDPSTSVNVSTTSGSISSIVLSATSSASGTAASSSHIITPGFSTTQSPFPLSSSISSPRSSSSSSVAATSSSQITLSQFSPSSKVSISQASSPPSTSTFPIVPTPGGFCSSLLIDDFSSQYRLAVLCQNALLQPSSDDNTMVKMAVANNHVTLFPVDSHSYFYTSFGCINATKIYGGISLTISAPVHTVIVAEFQTSHACNPDSPSFTELSSKELNWSFDGTERIYRIPFAKIPALDTDHLISLRFFGFRNVVTLGSMAFYCAVTAAYGA